MKNFTLVHESPSHFVLHNGISHFHIAKHGLDEPTMDKIRSLAKGGKVDEKVSPDEALNQYVPEKGIIGGTVRDGSDEERFHFGKFTFDIDKAREISKEKSNAEIPVSTKWLDKIKIDKEAAMRGTSDKPVFIAQIHTPHGLKSLLIDGNHRMHRSVESGEKTISAYVFTPEQSISLLTDKYPKDELKKIQPNGSVKKASGGGQLTRNSTHSYYNDGGAVEQQESFKLEEPPRADLDEVYKPQPLPTPESMPKRREIEMEMPVEKAKAYGGDIPYRKPQKYADGDEVGSPSLWEGIKKAFKTPEPETTPAPDKDEEIRRKSRLSVTDPSNPEAYYKGGSVRSNAVKDISHETQTQAIKRYAAGNPANLAAGGKVPDPNGSTQDQGGQFLWHRNGKYHFHFYDGAPVTTPLDKEQGAGPQQPTALDKYVGGKPANGTPLDNYAEGGDVPESADVSDSDKLAQAAQDLQSGLNAQTEPQAPAASSEGTYEEAPVVPAAQQIPAAPKPLPVTPDQQPNMLSAFDKALQQEQAGIEQGAAAQSEGYKQTAEAIGQNVLEQRRMRDAYNIEADKITQQNSQLFQDVASSKIDPNHFWNSKSTGGKIMASIGVLLGGIAGGANRTNQNQVLAQLQNHIQQDIEAQRLDQSNKMNLYKMGLERYRDAQSAQQFATLQSNALLQGQLQKIAAMTGSQQAQATAQQMIGQLGVQNAGIRSELALKQAAFGAMNQAPVQAGVDPNKLRLLINAGVIPKEEVPASMKEFGDYQKLNEVLDHTDDVFKNAAQTANYRERIANALPLGAHIPTITNASKQYEAITDAWLGNITKDTEGRVTPADIQLMRASLPKAGDNPQLIQSKLSNIKDMIREKYAFPTLQSYRLLSPKDPIAQSSASRQKKFTEGPPK